MKRLFLCTIFACWTAMVMSQTITVASYNIRYKNSEDSISGNGWERRCHVICDLINWEQPLVWGGQEVLHSQLTDMLARLDKYDYIGVGRDDGQAQGEYAPIFYRKENVNLLESGYFWLSETPDQPSLGWDAACKRICTWGHFRLHDSQQEFLFFNLHMDHVGVTARREAAKLVMKRIAANDSHLPAILTGDFNVDQENEIYSIFTQSGLLNDAFTTSRLHFAENGTFQGYHTERHTTGRIDHIFVTTDITVDAYATHTDSYWTEEDNGTQKQRLPSDHYPVFARIALPNQR
ncbi:MAG: endonuclease/exonuclease/phosphatase family protein [Bacteroidaceae bacterium]|nr:endonuclease/exonuclease/phosphatase family protein [Bacteroidaceae bacterium]